MDPALNTQSRINTAGMMRRDFSSWQQNPCPEQSSAPCEMAALALRARFSKSNKQTQLKIATIRRILVALVNLSVLPFKALAMTKAKTNKPKSSTIKQRKLTDTKTVEWHRPQLLTALLVSASGLATGVMPMPNK
jgi:hypothetical protein